MKIQAQYWSYCRDLTGCSQQEIELPEGAKLGDALSALYRMHPKLEQMRKSILVAVGVDYQPRDYELKPGDQISLFPPVQGG